MQFSVAGALRLSRGGAQVEDRSFGGPQPRLVAAMLLVDRDRTWSAEQLAAQLWPAGRPERWRPAVRGLVSRLRRLLTEVGVEGDVITNRSGRYHVELTDLVVDLERARDQVVDASAALADERYGDADDLAGRARAVLSRPVLPGVDAPWVEELRHGTALDHVESLIVLGRARSAQARWSAARSVMAAALARAPFREDVWRDRMALEAAAGNTAAALRVYEDCRRQLADELGVDPSPDTQALHSSILHGIPVPVGAPDGDVPGSPGDGPPGAGVDTLDDGDRPASPYIGLRSFEVADADRFFGRDAAVQRLVELLADHAAVTVVGPSGSGKSSVVRAGLLPALAAGAIPDADTWPVVVVTPGPRPVRALAAALAGSTDGGDRTADAVDDLADRLTADRAVLHDEADRVLRETGADPAARLVVVIDQAEELFTVAPPEQASALLAAVTAAVGRSTPRVALVATMRADVYAVAGSNADMASLLSRSQLVIPPMSGAELEAAVVGPAALVGVTLERGIVGRIVDDATGQPGRLPLLQHTLWELWQHRDGSALTLEAYDRIGGLNGALARHAEQTWESIDDQELARRILLRSVVPSKRDGADSRRPIRLAELDGMADAQALRAVLETLVSNRLLQAQAGDDGVVYELAHEALLREWPRLRRWIDADRAAIAAAGELREAAADWEGLERDPGALYRGTKLDLALERLDGRADALPATARAFLDASRAARDQRRAQEAERAAERDRTNRRLRRQLAAVALVTVVAVVGGLVALDQRGQAQAEQRVAVARELSAASQAVVDEDPDLGILLALDAVARTRVAGEEALPEAEEALHRAVTASRVGVRVPGLGGSVAWHPDRDVFVTEGPEESGQVDIRDATTLETVRAFTGHDADINEVAFNADGSRLATAGDDGLVRVWEPDSGELLAEVAGGGQAWGLAFSPDGARVAAAWPNEAVVRIADLRADTEPVEIRARTDTLVDATSFSPDSEQLAIVDGGQVVVVDARTGDRLRRLPLRDAEMIAVAWSPDGGRIASSGVGSDVWVSDAETGEDHATLRGHTGVVTRFDWSDGGTRLATGARDGTARVWEIGDDQVAEVATVATTDGAVGGVAFSPDGERLLTGDIRVTAANIWNVGTGGGAEWINLPTSPHHRATAAFTPNGDLVVSGVDEPAVEWDLAQAERRRTFGSGDEGAVAIQPSPDGDLVATAGSGAVPQVRVWDRRTGDEVFAVRQLDYYPEAVAWSPDGTVLAVAGSDGRGEPGRILVVDRDGTRIAEIVEDPNFTPTDLAFGPDGERLATARTTIDREDPTAAGVRVWDWRSGDVLADVPEFAEVVAFDPTGLRIAVAGVARGGSIWSAETGERLATLTGHTGDVTDVTFSTDATTLATSGADGTVRLWETETWTEQLVLHSHEGRVTSVAISPDGDRLVSTSGGVARVWALDIDDLVAIAEDRLTRSMTDDECRRYLHVEECERAP